MGGCLRNMLRQLVIKEYLDKISRFALSRILQSASLCVGRVGKLEEERSW